MTDKQALLYRCERTGISHDGILAEIAELGLSVEFGMTMAPNRFDLVRVGKDGIETFDGSLEPDVLLGGAYEIRFFGGDTDAHWQRMGIAGRLTISTVAKAIAGEPVNTIGHLDRHYRMFGKAEDSGRDGWSLLKASRIRPFPVPLTANSKVLVLTAVEHIAALAHGNAVVVAERLTGIEIAGKKGENDER